MKRVLGGENTESESVPDRARSVLGCLLLADADGLICAVGTVTVEEVELGRAALAVVELAFVVATFARTLAHRAREDLASSVWMRLAEKHLLVGGSADRVSTEDLPAAGVDTDTDASAQARDADATSARAAARIASIVDKRLPRLFSTLTQS